MDIKIKTTKKKLTVSMLKQMYELHYDFFDNIEILGYVSVGRKTTNKSALVYSKTKNDYYLLNMLWERRDTYAGRDCRDGGEYVKRIDADLIDDWFKKYNRIVEIAENKGHIYV